MLKPGDQAPQFDLPSATGDRIARVALAGLSTELVLLFFYPRDFSFICPTEVIGFNKALNFFTDENTTVLGASVDDADSHVRWARELGGIGYPLLADQGGAVARAYGVYDDKEKTAMRATFVLDRERKVAFAAACPVNVGRSVSETLRVVRAIRTGRLCPAEWKPGDAFGPSDLRY
jgi:peroxiredoxin (alkyl hydroperoxide reductase subunit C)